MKQRFILAHRTARQNAAQAVIAAPEGYVVRIEPPKRSLDQNALMWPLLTDIAQQVPWGGKYRSPDDWKDLLTAAFRRCEMVEGIDGGIVVLGMRTSQMGRREFSDFIESIYAFGTERGVAWSNEEIPA